MCARRPPKNSSTATCTGPAAITTQQSVAQSQQTQLQTSISNLQNLDFASAITTLDQQNTTLSAALQAFTLTQGLSLFKYL